MVTRSRCCPVTSTRHPRWLRGDRDDALPREIGSVGNGRRNVLRLERRVLFENAFRSFTGSEIVEHNRNRYPGPPEAHSAVHDLRIGGDVRFAHVSLEGQRALLWRVEVRQRIHEIKMS